MERPISNQVWFTEERMSEQLTKFYFNGVPFFSVMHRFTGADMGLPHDHPFNFTSFVMYGGYTERIYYIRKDGSGYDTEVIDRNVGDSFYVSANTIHEIIHLPAGIAYTQILPQQEIKKWGFYQFYDRSEPMHGPIMRRYHDEKDFKPYPGAVGTGFSGLTNVNT